MAFQEKDLESLLHKWYKENWIKEVGISAGIETKLTKTNTLNFKKIEPHQYTKMYDAKHSMLSHKISDSAIGFKPLDRMIVCGGLGLLAVCFYKPRQKKTVYFIDIDDLLSLRNISGKKSLCEADCQNAYKIITL